MKRDGQILPNKRQVYAEQPRQWIQTACRSRRERSTRSMTTTEDKKEARKQAKLAAKQKAVEEAAEERRAAQREVE